MVRVLVVDDSPSVRELLVYVLGSDPGIEIVGCAVDGEQAVHMAQLHRPDVITMDLHMPNVDGYEATRRIMQTCPVPIVIVSGSESQAEIGASFHAIEAGALMVVRRPFGLGNPAHQDSALTLIRNVKAMAEVKVVRRWPKERRRHAATGSAAAPRKGRAALVLLGASTGGPAVLRDILAQLPADYPLPLVIVQHIAPGFTHGLAQWLSSASGFPVEVAVHEQALSLGCAYLAPDGQQLGLTRDLRVALSAGPGEHGMCPSVSHLFRSVHPDLRPATVAVLLTGMGKDGALELKELKDDGALTVVQDRASSVVYGMPGEAIRQDAAMLILDPVEIGKILHGIASKPLSDLTDLGA